MADKKKLGFAENFMLSGVAAGVSKTAAAPIERVKLLVQNQDEMIKQVRYPSNREQSCTYKYTSCTLLFILRDVWTSPTKVWWTAPSGC